MITTNLQPVDLSATTDTNKFLTNFFQPNISIASNDNDAIISFFIQVTNNPVSAKILASAVIYTAAEQNLNVLVVLEEFKKIGKGNLDQYIAYFLNTQRFGSSYLGINTGTFTNKFTSRTVIY